MDQTYEFDTLRSGINYAGLPANSFEKEQEENRDQDEERNLLKNTSYDLNPSKNDTFHEGEDYQEEEVEL